MVFAENRHETLWGFESWTCSAFRSSPSVIADGPLAGRTLAEAYPRFPLLMKEISARERLSVQVHPSERTCLMSGGDPKTEMWCALEEGTVFAGLREGTSAKDVEAAVATGRFEELLVEHRMSPGDILYIPGGTVHAIGDGTRVYEVQQSSDTTFRLYDWGRKGADGRPRALHVAEALKAMDSSLPPPVACRTLDTPYFSFRQETVAPGRRFSAGKGRFLALYFVEDSLQRLLEPGEEWTADRGGWTLEVDFEYGKEQEARRV